MKIKFVSLPAMIFSLLLLAQVAAAETQGVSYKDTIRAVISYNPTLRALQENRTALLHEVEKIRGNFLPKVDVYASGSAGTTSTSTTRQTNLQKGIYPGVSTGLSLTQMVWDGRLTSSLAEAASFRVESIDYRLYDNITSLALEGLIAHVDLLRRQEMLVLANEYVKTHKVILEKQRNLVASGLSTNADISQAEGRLARAQASVAEAMQMLKTGEVVYKRLTGEKPGYLLPAEAPVQLPLSPEDSLAIALEKNDKIKTYKADIKAAQSDTDSAKAAYQPTVTLGLGPNYSDPTLTVKSNDYQWDMNATVAVRWNLYSGGSHVAAAKSAAARTRQVRQELFSVKDTITEGVFSAWEALVAARDLENIYTNAVGYNVSTRDIYLEQFAVGERMLLDVLDAETELYSSQVQLLTAKSNILINEWKLIALQGLITTELELPTQTLFTATPTP